MKKLLLSATLACLLAVPALAQQVVAVDYAWLSRYAKANSQIVVNPRVVFFGDSITDDWPNKTPSFFTDNNYLGRGIGGQTTSSMLLRFRPDVVDLKPEVVVILAGTNDVAENNGRYDQKLTIDNLKNMCDIAKANGIEPILCAVMPVNAYVWNWKLERPREKVAELSAELKKYAEANGVRYVDYFAAMRNDENGMKDGLANDSVHPNEAGYALMVEMVSKELDNYFNSKEYKKASKKRK
jgi:lysophospholipase L1-like esterase